MQNLQTKVKKPGRRKSELVDLTKRRSSILEGVVLQIMDDSRPPGTLRLISDIADTETSKSLTDIGEEDENDNTEICENQHNKARR